MITLSKHKDRVKNYFQHYSPDRKTLKLKWWKELTLIIVFYGVYSLIRNQFGSNSASTQTALDNAISLIDFEELLGLYREPQIQSWFVNYKFFIQFWNIFYGLCHFAVTILTFIWLYVRFPWDFAKNRTIGLVTTGLGLIGFATFPVMPPRLLGESKENFGGELANTDYVDTIKEYGGLWSFDSGTVSEISNQYAAMPSIHIAWAIWCAYIIYGRVKNKYVRTLAVLYPVATLFAIVVTANHYWIDAAGGVAVLAIAYFGVKWIYNYLESTRNKATT